VLARAPCRRCRCTPRCGGWLPKAAEAFARDVLHPQHLLTATRFNAVVSPHRVFDTRRFAVDEFESIRSLVPGASLQDAVLAVCAGGLRRYLELHDELPGSDLSADVSEPGAPNNATDPSPAPPATRRVPLGTTLADPVERLAFIHAHTSAHGAAAPTQATQAARQLPPPCCNLTVVSSPVQPVYLVGARMTYFSALLPIADGLGLTFAISRYDDRIVISPTSCRELMPDPQAFTQGVRDCFQDLLALAARRSASSAQARRMPPGSSRSAKR
jgi:diacylglycerol O-acyltransferase